MGWVTARAHGDTRLAANTNNGVLQGSLRQVLLVLLVMTMVPVLLAQMAIYYGWFHSRQEDELHGNQDVARAIAAAMDSYVLDVRRHQLAIGMALASRDGRGVERPNEFLDQNRAEYTSIRAIHWIGAEGLTLASSDPRAVGVDLRDRGYFKELAGARPDSPKDWSVSDLVTGRSSGEPTIVIARAIYSPDGQLQGIVSASIDPAKLGEGTISVQPAEQGAVAVFDRDGVLICQRIQPHRPAENRSWRGDDPFLDSVLKDGKERSGSFAWPTDGQMRTTAHVRGAETGWVVAASSPTLAVAHPLWQNLQAVMVISLLAAIISISMALLISRRITAPVRMLHDHALALGRGELAHRTEVGGITEMAQLSEAFNEMADRLQDRDHTLEATRLEAESLAQFPALNPLPVLRIARNGTLLYANAGSEELLQHWKRQVGQCVPDDIRQIVLGVLTGGVAKEHDAHCGDRVFSFLFAPIVADDHVNVYARDITERKRAEEKLILTAGDLARSNKDLEQFAYVASHDLQEPLRMVTGYLQLLERRYKGQLDPDADDFINFAVDGAFRMQQLITDLLAYSRVGMQGGTFEAVDCQIALDQAMVNLGSSIRESGAEISHDPLPTVKADPTQLVQLLQNLIGNAIKFCGQRQPKVHIGVRSQNGQWIFSVKDNGIGIEKQYLKRIFVIFQRLHGREEYPGTGIGLAICKRIVERHGGNIWVESEPEQGSTVFFTL